MKLHLNFLRQLSRLALLICVLGIFTQAAAQLSVSSATLSGRIEDPNGAGVGGARIIATNTEKNINTSTMSDAEGRFRFPNLAAGSYLLKVEGDGFATVTRELTLTVGQAFDIVVPLSVAGTINSVNVIETQTVETTRTQVSDTILPREIDRLPLNGRNTLDLALLVPGVSRTNTGSVQRFAETSAVPGTGISIAGQRNLNNSFIVDGLSANDDAADLAGTFYGEDVIREFQVVTSGGVAEFSRASSGFVNVITQSGTNDWRG
ncbi:MAG: carboxypeptidase regulatory-like domain-containing protein, partial [Acidobacteria bacterium]|nr:carboxypeptidase regulatory-like domain-containing protein [Acidobacteriota bacterium]